MEQTELRSAQLVNVKVSICPFFLKQENMNEYGHSMERKLKEKAIPQGHLRRLCSQFPLNMKRSAATHQ